MFWVKKKVVPEKCWVHPATRPQDFRYNSDHRAWEFNSVGFAFCSGIYTNGSFKGALEYENKVIPKLNLADHIPNLKIWNNRLLFKTLSPSGDTNPKTDFMHLGDFLQVTVVPEYNTIIHCQAQLKLQLQLQLELRLAFYLTSQTNPPNPNHPPNHPPEKV